MRKINAQKKMSQAQLYPLAAKPSESPTSWVSLKYVKSSGNNVDYLVIHKPKSKMSFKQLFSHIFRHTILWDAFVTIMIIVGYFMTTSIYVYTQPRRPFDWEFYLILICDIVYLADVVVAICLKIMSLVRPNVKELTRGIGFIIVDSLLAPPYSTGHLLAFWDTNSKFFLILRLGTSIRLYRLVVFFANIEKSIQRHRWAIFYVKFFAYFLVMEHFFACVWYLSPRINRDTTTTWSGAFSNNTNYQKSIFRWYLLTSYFSVTLLNQIGFGDFFPVNMFERPVATVAMCFGTFSWSYYISCLTILFLRKKYPQYKVRKQLTRTLKHLSLIGADKALTRKCVQYYEVLWMKRDGITRTKKLEDLPNMIAVHMNQKSCSFLLKYSMIFHDKPASFLRNVCLYIKHEFFSAEENVYTENKLKEKMIIIKSGTVNILSEEDNETPIISLGAGTCLGEISLIINVPSKVSVKAATYLEIYAIYAKDFCKIITNYPDFYLDIRQAIYSRISKRLNHPAKIKPNWKDLKQLLRDRTSSSTISNPIVTKYASLYKISSAGENLDVEIPESKKKFKWVRSNESISVLLWEFFIVACAIVVAIFYPYFAAFRQNFPTWFGTISNIIQIIFVIDIYVLLTTCVIKNGRKIDTIKGILEERMDTFSFYMDVFASFHLEVYSVLAEDEDRFYYLLKLNRVLKLVRISTLSKRLGDDLSRSPIKIACAKYAIFIFFFLYWSSLLLYAQNCLHKACAYDGWFLSKLKTSVAHRRLTVDNFGKFLMSLYYGLSNNVGVGIGDIVPVNMQDMMFSIVIIIVGKIIFGYCLAEFSSSLAFVLRSRNKYEDLRFAVHFYSDVRSIPRKLETRIRHYFDVQWRYDEAHVVHAKKSLLHDLPKYLRRDVLASEKLATLRKFVIFEEMDDAFLGYLLQNSRTLVVGPNEIVTYFGSINREMYFICRGLCLKQTDNNTYETIGAGSCIGFSSLLFGLPSLTNVCTLTHCILIHINVQTFNNALHQTPLLYRVVYKTRQQILAKYQSNYEVKMIENPHYTKRKKKLKLKYKKLNEKVIKNKSFVNAYKYCVSNKESYSKLSNTAGKICFLKYLLMPISILPYGPFLKIWSTLRLAIALTLFLIIPLEYLFSPYKKEMHYFQFILEIVAYTDIYLRFHVAFYGSNNQLVIHPWSTAEHYLKGQFLPDIFIWFPYPVGILAAYNHTEGHSEFAHSLSPHLFHCCAHLMKILDVYRVFSALRYFGEDWNRHFIFRCFKYIFFTILLLHCWTMILMISTCKYLHTSDVPKEYIIGNMTKIPGVIPLPTSEYNLHCVENSWLSRSHFGNYSTISQVYLAGVYFVLQTMAGVGFGDIFAETRKEMVMVVLIIITGFVFYGYLLVDIISHSTRPRLALLIYESKFLHLISYMKQENVDHTLKERIKEYIQYKWNRTRNVDIHFLLSQMNATLHEDVTLYLYETTLRHVPMFENVDHSFFRVIGKELKEIYFMEGDTVLNINDIVRDIYIIHKGTAELSSPHNMIPVLMGIGGVFGNVFEKDSSLCGITVRAMKNLDLLRLDVEKFRRMLKDYPFIQKKLNAFPRNEKHKHYAIPNSFVDDGNVYLNPNMYWSTKRLSGTKKSLFSSCKDSITPENHRCTAFSCFLLFATYCNYILTAYQFCFQQYCSALLTTAVVIDVIFLLKFCMEINAPYVEPPGFLYNRSFFAKCMQRKWRKTLDFLANLPIGYTVLFVPFISNDSANFYFSVWRLLTLLRLYYMFHFFVVLKEKLMAKRFFLELSIFVLFSTMFCHLLACLWYLMICPWNNCSDTSWIPASATHAPEELYVISLYVVVSAITCTGVGDIIPQTASEMFIIIVYIALAKICLGYFIAQLIRMLQCGSVWLMKYETVMEHLRSYYANMGAHKNQINYMINYMSALWKKRNGLQRYELVSELPRTLRIDLMTGIYGKLIKDSYIFCRTERDFIRQLCLQLKHRTYFPGDYIVRDGDVDSSMYFIHRGDVQILTIAQTVNETVHEVLHKDEVFGIVQGLFKEIPHHFSFRALTLVDLAVLELSEWEYLLDFFPKSKDIIYQRVEEIYYTI